MNAPQARTEANEALCGLIDTVVLTPSKDGYSIDLRGDLAGILSLSVDTKKKPPVPEWQRRCCKYRWLRELDTTGSLSPVIRQYRRIPEVGCALLKGLQRGQNVISLRLPQGPLRLPSLLDATSGWLSIPARNGSSSMVPLGYQQATIRVIGTAQND